MGRAHLSRPHFPACPAARCGHGTKFWTRTWKHKRFTLLISRLTQIQCKFSIFFHLWEAKSMTLRDSRGWHWVTSYKEPLYLKDHDECCPQQNHLYWTSCEWEIDICGKSLISRVCLQLLIALCWWFEGHTHWKRLLQWNLISEGI